MRHPDTVQLEKEIKYRTSRSGGKGGQHVNKVETAVELLFDVAGSKALAYRQKSRILEQLGNRIDGAGVLHLRCDTTRSQKHNKELVFQRFIHLLNRVLAPPKKRIATRVLGRALVRRRISKQRHSEKKMRRRKPDRDNR